MVGSGGQDLEAIAAVHMAAGFPVESGAVPAGEQVGLVAKAAPSDLLKCCFTPI